MYFNFDDRQPDIDRIDRAISWREGFLLSLLVHVLGILAIILLPQALPSLFAALAPDPSAIEQRMAAMREQEANERRFVFVQRRVAELAKTAIEFPPMQKGASFNLEAVKAQIEAAVKARHGQ